MSGLSATIVIITLQFSPTLGMEIPEIEPASPQAPVIKSKLTSKLGGAQVCEGGDGSMYTASPAVGRPGPDPDLGE